MFSKAYNWINGIEHDVEQIIANFTDTVTKLEAAAVAKLNEAENHLATSLHYQLLYTDARAASDKAATVAGKIKELVS